MVKLILRVIAIERVQKTGKEESERERHAYCPSEAGMKLIKNACNVMLEVSMPTVNVCMILAKFKTANTNTPDHFIDYR